jgi:prolyl oligopeptidase PreP (S9A serine peptidase family)
MPHAINYFVPFWDGQQFAYGMSSGGSEDASLYILQVATGQLVGAPIPRVQQGLVPWLPDSRSLTFNQLKMPVAGEPATEVYLDSQVYWLTVGQAPSAAIPVFGPTVTRGLGLSRLRRFTGTDKTGILLPTGFAGASRLYGDPSHAYTDVLFTLSGWTEGPKTFRWDGQTLTDTGLRLRIVAAGLPEITVTELLAPSYDGTLIPMTVLHRKGLVLDGKNLTLLRCYGEYDYSEIAYYSPGTLVWIEQGRVMAHANVRGSGVSGRAITTAPELFAAAIIQVGILDAIRSEKSANGITNISEFGTVKHPLEFAALLEMSTYHQIQDGVGYPAVMLVHGMGRTTTQRRSESADAFAFLLWQMDRANGPRLWTPFMDPVYGPRSWPRWVRLRRTMGNRSDAPRGGHRTPAHPCPLGWRLRPCILRQAPRPPTRE